MSNALLDTTVDAMTCWNALIDDSIACVWILDEHGRIEYANRVTKRLTDDLVGDPAGHKLHDLFDEKYADERVAFIREAIENDTPVVYDGMFRGVAWRTVFRPLPRESGQPGRVLAVGRPASGPDQATDTRNVRRARTNDLGPLSTLTRREFEVLGLIGEGLSTAQIAERLGRSVKTVEGHRVSLGAKLEATNRVELARIAIRAGLCKFDAAKHEEADAKLAAG